MELFRRELEEKRQLFTPEPRMKYLFHYNTPQYSGKNTPAINKSPAREIKSAYDLYLHWKAQYVLKFPYVRNILFIKGQQNLYYTI